MARIDSFVFALTRSHDVPPSLSSAGAALSALTYRCTTLMRSTGT